ncbi:MAG: DUF1292 domain-containing protein [Peptococcaceae bacterium]|jgi:uncharacterized protein YrzB (UPF0473 family)|nr:DUF1292 domain-containing protein [Peptococcaceae bacterium]
MGDEHEMLDNDTVVLVDEEGEEHTFSMLDIIELDGCEYAVLQPVDDDVSDEEEPEAVILKIETDENGEEILTDIEDDDEWEKVADAWQDAMESEESEDE